MKVKIKKISADAQVPCKATAGAAAYDLYSTEKVYIPPAETVAVGTGLSMEIPKGWRGDIYSRSGMAAQGVVVANSPGKIDSDYRGEIMVLLHNNRRSYVAAIEVGDKIAQFEISKVQLIQFKETEELPITERGSDGFGSTGK